MCENAEFKRNLLQSDFESSYEEHRHYDEVNWDLTKFCFGQVIVILGACWTLLSIGNDKMPINISPQSIVVALLALSVLFVILSVIALCQNRTYFVRVNNYINKLRSFALSDGTLGIENDSKMWTDTKMKILNWKSTQLICIYMCILCGGIPAFALGYILGNESFCLATFAIVLYLLISVALMLFILRES